MPRTVVRHEGEHLYAEQPSAPEGRKLSQAILHLRRAEHVQVWRGMWVARFGHVARRQEDDQQRHGQIDQENPAPARAGHEIAA